MEECLLRYRPSGGRGEYEFTPGTSLLDLEIVIRIPAYGIDIPSEVWGRRKDGKPRLRKLDGNDRSKLHVPPLILALAKLPEPAREDKGNTKVWPLENKGFIADTIRCEIIARDGETVTIVPKSLTVLHSDKELDLDARFADVAYEIAHLPTDNAALTAALKEFAAQIYNGVNSRDIRIAADAVIDRQSEEFGPTNVGSTKVLKELEALPPSDLEDGIEGTEGRLLTRWHSYRERDRDLVKKAKAAFKAKHGKLFCECCSRSAADIYGERGEDRIHAHHRTPIEQIIPGATTKAEDLAMVCPTCHDVIHAKRPWISVEDVRSLLTNSGAMSSAQWPSTYTTKAAS